MPSMHTMVLIAALFAPVEPARFDEAALARALERRLTYPASLAAGRPYQVQHCRRAPRGCRERLEAFAGMFVRAGRETGVSPWLLAAMGMSETALNPFAEGEAGERGILQIHPARRDGRKLRFLRDARYRERCKREVGACQDEVVSLAAAILARAIGKCGDTEAGLRMYNSGRCNGRTSYPHRVSKELARLYEYATTQRQGDEA